MIMTACGDERSVTVIKEDNSCLLSPVGSGYNLICPNDTVFIPDSGSLPEGAALITGITNPCGDDPAISQDEVLLITSFGEVFAYFEDGSNRRLSLLIPHETYSTTDGGNCTFRVDENGDYTYESHDYGEGV